LRIGIGCCPSNYFLTDRFCAGRVKKRLPGAFALENIPTWIPVVAGAICDGSGRILLQRRPAGKPHAGLWEFPGGKVEKGESPRRALVRELNEELSITVDPSAIQPIGFAESQPEGPLPGIVILLYRVSRWRGEPVAEKGAKLDWFDYVEADRLPLPPLDRRLLGDLSGADQ
jgi:8-oxo-dGTP diphosphatase